MSGASQRRTPSPIARIITLGLIVAACAATVDPVTTIPASGSPPLVTAVPSSGPFVKTTYPVADDAPCGEKEPADTRYGPYRGEFKRIRAKDPVTVVFELCQPDPAFLAKIASPAFSINDDGWLRTHVDPDERGPQAIVKEVNGTGPYRLESWNQGTEVSLLRNDGYWGVPALNERAIVRWVDDDAQLIQELRDGSVDGIDAVADTRLKAVVDDVGLTLAVRHPLNTFYLGFTNTFAPFDNEGVRRAIAMGIDRRTIVDSFFPAGAEVASHYAPCTIPFGCAGDPWYEYDPILAKELLVAAGYPDGFETTIQYRAAARPYLPDPLGVASEIQAQLLANLGIRAELVVVPEDTYLDDVDAGRLDGIHLLGQTTNVPDMTDLLEPRFGPGASAEFGSKFDDIAKALAAGRATVDARKRSSAYAKANDAIRTHVPMIPVARTSVAAAFRVDVDGPGASPLHLERFASMTPGDRRQFVWSTATEPAGLYCADETDDVAYLVCAQLLDTLYVYAPTGTEPAPSLAKTCDPNPELTIWTCSLRPDILFHDGAVLDANDVVISFAVQWDRSHPLHHGRDGGFERFGEWFGGFLHPVRDTP